MQLQFITLDNALANRTLCEMVQHLHEGQNTIWNASKNQLMYVLPSVQIQSHCSDVPGVSDMLSTLKTLTK